MKNLAILILTLLCSPFFLNAQSTCGFDEVRQKLLKQDSSYEKAMRKNDAMISSYIASHPGNGETGKTHTLYTIPVVVHVIHTGQPIGGLYNPDDTQIIGAIDYLNQVYAGTYPGTQGVGDIQIQFALAQRDPNCNPTNGIERIDLSASVRYAGAGVNMFGFFNYGESELTIKNLSRWDVSSYYNIWVVNMIDGKTDPRYEGYIAGYAYYPGASADVDGLVIRASEMEAGKTALPHEMAHALGLYDVYEGGSYSVCPPNTDCGVDGDRVCDTDPVTKSPFCRTSINSCSGEYYSIYTEFNYMSYSNCHTLFTPGQKDRMLAAMSLPSRASLATSAAAEPTYSSNLPCPPKVNFEQDRDAVTEKTQSTDGCRSYKDYVYYITISNAPLASATATLLVTGGTAIEGADFDITTNGSFTSPSKVLQFPAGAHGAQSFTVRIYDDAEVENKETFTLKFSIDNGGGNAVPGDGKVMLTVFINDNDILPIHESERTLTGMVGSPDYVETFLPVFNANIQKSRGQILYTAAQLSGAGIPPHAMLTGFSFYIKKNSTRPFRNLNVKMTQTALPYLGTPYMTLVPTLERVAAFDSYETVNGWNYFAFDTPFTWDGVSNVVIDICFDNITDAPNSGWDFMYVFKGAGLDVPFINSCYYPTLDCKSTSPLIILGAGNDSKPATEFNFEHGTPKNPVVTNITMSEPAYLGPHADIYFYNDRGEILARIKNMTSFDYGCTRVSIDRAGNTSSPFWDNNPMHFLASKSFKVLPANNTDTGRFQIDLYYTEDEINGWQNSTGGVLAEAKMVEVSNGFYVPDITPANPHVADISMVNITSKPFGADHVLTGEFNNSLSGFGIGVVDRPVTLVMRIFPNPVEDQLTIEFPQPSSDVVFRVFSQDGKLVQQKKSGFVNRYEKIRTQGLAAGVYLLRIETPDNLFTAKFVKR